MNIGETVVKRRRRKTNDVWFAEVTDDATASEFGVARARVVFEGDTELCAVRAGDAWG